MASGQEGTQQPVGPKEAAGVQLQEVVRWSQDRKGLNSPARCKDTAGNIHLKGKVRKGQLGEPWPRRVGLRELQNCGPDGGRTGSGEEGQTQPERLWPGLPLPQSARGVPDIPGSLPRTRRVYTNQKGKLSEQ